MVMHNHRDAALWVSCFSVCFFVVGFFAWLQDRAWKGDLEKREENHRGKERARIVVFDVFNKPLTPVAGELYRVIVALKNVGQTAAKNCRITIAVEPVPAGSKPTIPTTGVPTTEIGVMLPGIEHKAIGIPVRIIPTGEETAITQELADQITSGRIRIFTHGRVDYEDVSGTPHWFTFCCHTLFPTFNNFGIWNDYNASDD